MVLLKTFKNLLSSSSSHSKTVVFRTVVSKVERMVHMTQNQISFYRAKQEAQHNAGLRALEQSKLDETTRSNKARESETHRSNVVGERETFRSNLARENELYRSNRAKEDETHRANQANENIKRYQNAITLTTSMANLAETTRHNKASEGLTATAQDEIKRHNIAGEQLTAAAQDETHRHNVANESETYRHNVRSEKTDLIDVQERTRHNRAAEEISNRQNEINQFRAATDRGIGEYNAKTNRINAQTSQYNADINYGQLLISNQKLKNDYALKRIDQEQDWALKQSQIKKNLSDSSYTDSRMITDRTNAGTGILRSISGFHFFD